MRKLILQTLPDRNAIAAFVASAEGRPESGLGMENFKVCETLPGADGSYLAIASVEASILRGFYVLRLTRAGRAPRRRGHYIFDLVVEKGQKRGQTMSSVMLT